MKRLLMFLVALMTAAGVTAPASAHIVLDVDLQPRSGTATLVFVGDMHFERHLTKLLQPGGMRGLSALWSDSDFVMGNLETAITSRGVRQDKIYTFRAPKRAIPALHEAGVDVVSMANNHALDFGSSGLKDTLRALKGQPLVAVGIGSDRASALAPMRIDLPDETRVHGSTPVSVFAVATSEMLGGLRWAASAERGGIAVWESHKSELLQAIKTEADQDRVVIVYVHWGRERENCPTATQRAVATALAKAGATIIVGAHPHVLQGVGRGPNESLIAYSMANFIWYHGRSGPTGVLKVRLENRQVADVTFAPARISTTGLPVLTSTTSPVFTSYATCAKLERF